MGKGIYTVACNNIIPGFYLKFASNNKIKM